MEQPAINEAGLLNSMSFEDLRDMRSLLNEFVEEQAMLRREQDRLHKRVEKAQKKVGRQDRRSCGIEPGRRLEFSGISFLGGRKNESGFKGDGAFIKIYHAQYSRLSKFSRYFNDFESFGAKVQVIATRFFVSRTCFFIRGFQENFIDNLISDMEQLEVSNLLSSIFRAKEERKVAKRRRWATKEATGQVKPADTEKEGRWRFGKGPNHYFFIYRKCTSLIWFSNGEIDLQDEGPFSDHMVKFSWAAELQGERLPSPELAGHGADALSRWVREVMSGDPVAEERLPDGWAQLACAQNEPVWLGAALTFCGWMQALNCFRRICCSCDSTKVSLILAWCGGLGLTLRDVIYTYQEGCSVHRRFGFRTFCVPRFVIRGFFT
eukprot:s1359_g3.t1